MKHYSLKVDDELWKKVKGKAGLKGISIKALITQLLEQWLQEDKN